jgi:hypothetical protein
VSDPNKFVTPYFYVFLRTADGNKAPRGQGCEERHIENEWAAGAPYVGAMTRNIDPLNK